MAIVVPQLGYAGGQRLRTNEYFAPARLQDFSQPVGCQRVSGRFVASRQASLVKAQRRRTVNGKLYPRRSGLAGGPQAAGGQKAGENDDRAQARINASTLNGEIK